MPIYQTLFSMESDSALPEDRIINTFHFQMPSDAAMQTMANNLFGAYNNTLTGGFRVADFLGERLGPDVNIRAYDLADPTPRVPVVNSNYTWTVTPNDDQLPSEVAVCLSFKAAPGGGVPRARQRGRVYIGPLSLAVLDDTANEPRVDADLQTALLDMAENIHDNAIADGGHWIVWSTVDAAGYNIVDAWVDDSFDTQRRRGVRATSRATRTL